MIKLPYGKNGMMLEEGDAKVLYSRVAEMKAASGVSGRQLVRTALENPVGGVGESSENAVGGAGESSENSAGGVRLRDLARGKKTCTFIISDHTRPVPSKDIVPEMLAELRAGNPSIDITLLVATGCHRETRPEELRAKLGDEVFEREKIVVHDCDHGNVEIGVLPSGAPLVIDELAVKADLLVAEGFIEPHFFAGFSGGRKSILPGICDRVTVLGNHCGEFCASPFARTGILEGNPIHEDMLSAVRQAGLDFIVNAIIDSEKRTVAVFAGDPVEAHLAGCAYLSGFCQIEAEPADIVITSNGGAPLDQNFYQAVKCMTAGEAAAKEGGVIIALSESADGIGGDDFYKQMSGAPGAAELYAQLSAVPREATVQDQWQSQIFARILAHHTVIVVAQSGMREAVEACKCLYAASADEALAMAKRIVAERGRTDGRMANGLEGYAPTVTIIPDGVSVIVKAI